MKTLISIPGLQFVTSSKRRRSLMLNTIDSLNPEIWARESLLALQADLLMPNLQFVDFSDQVATWGDVVNINSIGSLTAGRKGAKCEDIVQQDVSASASQIELNQYIYTSFAICDGEENRPMRDLIRTYLVPAVRAQVELVDSIVSAQQMNFWGNSGGHLQGLTDANVDDYVLETREVMTLNKVPTKGRKLVLGVRSERPFLKNELYVAADKSGSTNTLRNGEIGRIYNMDVFSAYSQPYINPASLSTSTAAVVGAHAAGATVIAIDGASTATLPAGNWVVIAGDDVPQQITASTVASNAGNITISPGLKRAVADNAVVTWAKVGTITNGTYAGPLTNPKRYGWSKRISIDGVPAGVTPQVNQTVTFGTTTALYSMVQVFNTDVNGAALAANTFEVVLDRPLDAAVGDGVTVNLGPAGSFNFAFGEDALAIAIRPLAPPRVGALARTVNDGNFTQRAVISYNATKQAHIVTLDFLMGIATYRQASGAVMFG